MNKRTSEPATSTGSAADDTPHTEAAVRDHRIAFLTALGHELRTPLAVISGTLDTLHHHDDKLDDATRELLLSRARDRAHQAAALIDDLVTLGEPAVRTATRLRELAPDVHSGQDVTIDIDDATHLLDTAAGRRIIDHLLDNAYRHTPLGTALRLEIASHDDHVAISLHQTADAPTDTVLYQPLQQGPAVPEHKPGTGLGLAIGAHHARRHGGRAWTTTAPGQATYHVMLPAPRTRPDLPRAATGNE